MHKLILSNIDHVNSLTSPENSKRITTESPALSVFTDFQVTIPFTSNPDTDPVEAERLMLKAHVKMIIIVDAGNHFLGVLSLRDLDQDMIIRRVASGTPRNEITVADLMVPKSKLRAFSYQDLDKARVQDVLDALMSEGLQHCLVVDDRNGTIRGLISASDIARKMQIPLSLHKAPSFAEIVKAVSTASGLQLDTV